MKRCPKCQAEYTSNSWLCPGCGYLPVIHEGFTVLSPELVQSGIRFPMEAHSELALLECRNFWFCSRNDLIIWALSRYFSRFNNYLEVGCGTGYVLAGVARAFPRVKITGSEVYSAGLSFAAKRVRQAELLLMDARSIPFTEEFDVIAAFDVLEHIKEDELVLYEMFRSVRPEGGIIITVPQHPWLWSRQDEYACHVRRYRVDELSEKLHRIGFHIEFKTSFVSLLLPIMFISRMVFKNVSSNSDPLSELRMPTWLNYIFTSVMSLERYLLRSGVRLPVGGSLLIIAKKRSK